MSSPFTRLLMSQLKQINKETLFWAFPAAVGAGWLLWPALDYEWKMEMGLAPDPEAVINRVQAEKDQRLALKMKDKPAVVEDDEEEEEEEEAAPEEEEEEEEAAPAQDEAEDEEDVPAMEDGDDEDVGGEAGGGDDDEDEESEEAPPPPLYLPTKKDKLAPKDVWDNFTLKALKMVRVVVVDCGMS